MRKATKMLIPDTTIDKWHAEVCRIMEKELIGLGLFTEEDIKNQDASSPMFFKYYMHGTGHFLGLDVHDVGSKQMPLREGMVITCEPGIYIKEEGIGIRLENDIMVADEPIDLMAGIPLDADEIEALMSK
jgi:Xaa-Pro aminopeptidase